MKTFSIRDLRDRTGNLLRNVEAGKLSVITQHGRPVFVAVPFKDALLREGIKVALAIKLIDSDVISPGQGAKVADMTLAEFMEECSARNVPVVRHSPQELERELTAYDHLPHR
jgi:prevent-host-death family protein